MLELKTSAFANADGLVIIKAWFFITVNHAFLKRNLNP